MGRSGPIRLPRSLASDSAPTAYTPKEDAKKDQAADIHTHGVAELVVATGIILRINVHIVADSQVGKRQWHQSALDQTDFEACPLSLLVEKASTLIQSPADAGS